MRCNKPCPLYPPKATVDAYFPMSAFDPKRTCVMQDLDLALRWFRTIYEEFEIFPLGRRKRNSESGTLALKPGAEDQVDDLAPLVGVHPSNCWESTTSHVQFHAHDSSPLMSSMSALGQKQTYAMHQPMSALPLKADMCSARCHVCFGPIADSCIASNCVVIRSPGRRSKRQVAHPGPKPVQVYRVQS
jgi:hypothetical protein